MAALWFWWAGTGFRLEGSCRFECRIDLLAVRAFLTIKDFGLCGSWSFFVLFCSVFLLTPLVVALCYFRLGSECDGWDIVPGGLEWRGLFHPLV